MDERTEPRAHDPEGVPPSAEAPVQPAPPRFCRHCGSELPQPGAECPKCDAVPRPPAGASSALKDGSHRYALVDVIGLYIVLLATFLPIAIGAWSARPGESIDVRYEIATAAIDAVIVVLWALCRWRSLASLLFRRPDLRWLLGALGLAGGTFVFAYVFVEGLNATLGTEGLRLTDGYFQAGYGLGLVILVLCVQPAIVEELAFRGIIFDGLLSFLSRKETLIVSAVLFTVLHLTAFGVPQLVLGLLLGWIRLRSGALAPCILLHFTHNLLCVGLELTGG